MCTLRKHNVRTKRVEENGGGKVTDDVVLVVRTEIVLVKLCASVKFGGTERNMNERSQEAQRRRQGRQNKERRSVGNAPKRRMYEVVIGFKASNAESQKKPFDVKFGYTGSVYDRLSSRNMYTAPRL